MMTWVFSMPKECTSVRAACASMTLKASPDTMAVPFQLRTFSTSDCHAGPWVMARALGTQGKDVVPKRP